MDLKPFVYELNVRKNGEVPALFMKVSAGSAANIKPELTAYHLHPFLIMYNIGFTYIITKMEHMCNITIHLILKVR